MMRVLDIAYHPNIPCQIVIICSQFTIVDADWRHHCRYSRRAGQSVSLLVVARCADLTATTMLRYYDTSSQCGDMDIVQPR